MLFERAPGMNMASSPAAPGGIAPGLKLETMGGPLDRGPSAGRQNSATVHRRGVAGGETMFQRMWARRAGLALAVTCAATLALGEGCGGDGAPPVASSTTEKGTVHGTVTIKGKPA